MAAAASAEGAGAAEAKARNGDRQCAWSGRVLAARHVPGDGCLQPLEARPLWQGRCGKAACVIAWAVEARPRWPVSTESLTELLTGWCSPAVPEHAVVAGGARLGGACCLVDVRCEGVAGMWLYRRESAPWPRQHESRTRISKPNQSV